MALTDNIPLLFGSKSCRLLLWVVLLLFQSVQAGSEGRYPQRPGPVRPGGTGTAQESAAGVARPGTVRPGIGDEHERPAPAVEQPVPATVDVEEPAAPAPVVDVEEPAPAPVVDVEQPAPAPVDVEEPAAPAPVVDIERPGPVRPEVPTPVEAVAAEPPTPEDEPLPEDAVPIPDVIDRPFSADEGPFVQVQSFRLPGIGDLPRYDITVAEVQAVLDKAISEQPARGYSIGELQGVADLLTRYYRERGLILAVATVPVQTVVDGVVDIEVHIGVLGRVLAEGNERYPIEVLQKPFRRLIGQPVTKEGIEGALLTLTGFPGLSVYGVFQPGIKIGEADIILSVQDEKPFALTVRADTHGLREIGRNRLRVTGHFNNPSRGADRIGITVQESYNPKRSLYWSGEYERYLGWGLTGGVSYSQNSFSVAPSLVEDLDLSSETRSGNIYLEKSFLRSRQLNFSSRIALYKKHSDNFLENELSNRSNLTTLEGSVRFDNVDTFHPLRFLYRWLTDIDEGFGGGLNFADLRYTRGFNNWLGAMGPSRDSSELPAGAVGPGRTLDDGRTFVPGQFDKLSGSLSRLQLLSRHQSLSLRMEFQWTNDALTALEQYSIGGPNNVRAFPDAQGLFDRAWFASADYVFNAPFIADAEAFGTSTWGELIQFSLFYDFASARLNFPQVSVADQFVEETGSWITYRGYGMSLRFSLPGMIDSRVTWSRALGDNRRTPADNGHRAQLWGDITVNW